MKNGHKPDREKKQTGNSTRSGIPENEYIDIYKLAFAVFVTTSAMRTDGGCSLAACTMRTSKAVGAGDGVCHHEEPVM